MTEPSTGETKLQAWVRAQLETNRPRLPLSPGAIGRPIAELANAVQTLEVGGATLFGLHLTPDKRAELRPAAALARSILADWRRVLSETLGPEGTQAAEQILGRHGVVLDPPLPAWDPRSTPKPDEDAALHALAECVAHGDAISAWWRANDRLVEEEDVVFIETGAPDPARLDRFAAAYARAHAGALPAFYLRLLSTYNGLSAHSDEESDEPTVRSVPAAELVEPTIWPLESYGDHGAFATLDLRGIGKAFVFGELPDAGHLVFDALEADAPVFWIPRHLRAQEGMRLAAEGIALTGSDDVPPRLADSLAGFVARFAANKACLPALLGAAGVEGWGGPGRGV